MNNNKSETEELIRALKPLNFSSDVRVMIAPAYTHLVQAGALIQGGRIEVLAQNMNAAESGAFTGEISAGIVERQTLIDGIESLIEQQTQIFQAIMYLGLLFTIAVMLNTMIMNVAERDFELATLRVLGASTKRLGGMLLFESLLIGIIGGIVGVFFAYGGAIGLAASFSSWEFYVPVVLVPNVAFQLMFGVIIIAIAMTPIGVWRLRKMDLVEKVKDLSQ